MSCKRRMIQYSIALSAILAVSSILGSPTPSTARIVKQEVLSVQLAQSEEGFVIHSNLLTEEGQSVLLEDNFTELTVPITVSGGDLIEQELKEEAESIETASEEATESIGTEEGTVDAETAKRLATVTAVSSDTNWLLAELDRQSVLLQEEGCEIQLTLRQVEPEPEPEPEASGGDAAAGTDDVSGGDASGTETVSDNGAGATAEDMQDSGAVAAMAVEEIEKPEELSAKVTLQYRNHTFSVTFVIVEKEEDAELVSTELLLSAVSEISEEEKEEVSSGDAVGGEVADGEVSGGDALEENVESETEGELVFCPSQYHPTEAILVVNGDQDCILGGFPTMTRYTLEEKTYLLYHGGSVALPANRAVEIDLSQTDMKEDLMLRSGSGTEYLIRCTELPKLTEESYPLILGAEDKTIAFTCYWGELEPVFKAEQLVPEDDVEENQAEDTEETNEENREENKKATLIWKEVESILFEIDEEGNLRLKSEKAEAGTYRIVVSWIEDEITVYQMEIPFFVQYRSGDLGGSVQ